MSDMTTGNHTSIAEIERRFLEAAARGINRTANAVMADAIEEAPLGPAASAEGEGHEGSGGSGELRRSAHGPINDPASEATADDLEAQVSFNTAYATAQHEGVAEMTRGDTTYEWVVRHYTTPGTKKHFLSDPLKADAAGGGLERRIGEEVEKEFGR